uniref:AIG1-type G domain-containing protein n=1 Tax=Seriola dumerili TaxID=41447 RepID=A0A3B4T6W8_SERDU
NVGCSSLVSRRHQIVLLGKTGAGKSNLCNTIFGDDVFKINHTAKSETTKCQSENKSVNGRRITLIDTPGFFDTNRSEEELKPEMARCITECAPGPHAFLILLKVEKYTEQEQAVINNISQYFSEEAFKHAVVVFTHGDQLPEGMKIEEYFKDNKGLCDLVEKCGDRCHVIDNKYWNNNQQDEYRNNKVQVAELLNTIQAMVDKGGCYTNDMLQRVETKIQQEEKLIRQSSPDMSETEIREMAKINVSNHLRKIVGVTVGTLLGALLGVVLTAVVKGAEMAKTATGYLSLMKVLGAKDAQAEETAEGEEAAQQGETAAEAVDGAAVTTAVEGIAEASVEGAAEVAAAAEGASEGAAAAVEGFAEGSDAMATVVAVAEAAAEACCLQ